MRRVGEASSRRGGAPPPCLSRPKSLSQNLEEFLSSLSSHYQSGHCSTIDARRHRGVPRTGFFFLTLFHQVSNCSGSARCSGKSGSRRVAAVVRRGRDRGPHPTGCYRDRRLEPPAHDSHTDARKGRLARVCLSTIAVILLHSDKPDPARRRPAFGVFGLCRLEV